MASDASNGSVQIPTTLETQRSLEQRYISLLEKRIADLEVVLKNSPINGQAAGLATPEPSEAGEKQDEKPRGKGEDGEVPKEVTISSADKADSDDAAEKSNNETSRQDTKSRYRNVRSIYNEKKGIRQDEELDASKKSSSKAEKHSESEYAFTFRRVMSLTNAETFRYSEVEIHAQGLRSLLKEAIGDMYPSMGWEGNSIVMISYFPELVYNWDPLLEMTKAIDTDDSKLKEAREDLRQLLEHVKHSIELEAYFRTRDTYVQAESITFETLWTIFPPGQKVVARPVMDALQIFEVDEPPYPNIGNEEKTEQLISCWCYDWNGKSVVKAYYDIPIESFRNAKAINSLSCYPLKYHKEDSEDFKSENGKFDLTKLCDKIIQRGSRFDELCHAEKGAGQLFQYNDLVYWSERGITSHATLSIQDDNSRQALGSSTEGSRTVDELTSSFAPKPSKVKGKYIVDATAFIQFGPGELLLGQFSPADIEDLSLRSTDVPYKDRFLLNPPRVLGYSPKEKMWGQFKVESTTQVGSKPNTKAFDDDLQLDSKYKDVIKALVSNHERSRDNDSQQTGDIVEGKGKGLVILFHGPPGVGKTLTAETIAESTGKPLLMVSVAEIGLTASKAEKNLERMFHLAGTWEAILLVDEADVFLESRTSDGDPNRNALVSVLLRVLEYYQGIMILTTNRMTSLDIAVQSRIHLAIRYEDLSQRDKINIFKFFFDRLNQENSSEVDRIKEWINETAGEYKLNGRQIRNVVSTAHALACHDGNGKRITKEHFKKVTALTKEFQEQLESLVKARRSYNEVDRAPR